MYRSSRTKQLAKDLGLLPVKRKRVNGGECASETGGHLKRVKGQELSYLIVIDFESTCWQNKKGFQEIIEFPAVLLDLSTGKIVSEFHHYLTPVENPVLSAFCKELTGISQAQVDNGIPLPTCLYLFNQWIQKLHGDMGMVLMEPGREYLDSSSLCVLVTWSDWDLGVCLRYESSRKQIRTPTFFNQWIDVRAVYRDFYERRPAGLNGALDDLGIVFVGRQHSGIDDARNTAKLCHRLVCDGCRLKITKSIHKQKTSIKPPSKPALSNVTNLNSERESIKCLQTKHLPTPICALDFPSSIKNLPTSGNTDSSQSGTRLEINSASGDGDKPAISDCDEGHNGSYVGEDWEKACSNFFEDITADDEWNATSSTKVLAVASKLPERLPSNANMLSNMVCQANGNVELYNSAAPSRSAHGLLNPKTITPSRSKFLAHISPIALISPSTGHSYGASKELWKNGQKKMSLVPSYHGGNIMSPSTAIGEMPTCSETEPHKLRKQIYCCSNAFTPLMCHNIPMPLITSSSTLNSPVYIEETPPFKQIKGNRWSTDAFDDAISGYASPSLNPTPSVPETPKIAFLSTSSTICASTRSCSNGSTFNTMLGVVVPKGGKITPPLCRCGKRTKRKTVVTPGPNEGTPFYVCPNGRGSGLKRQSCGYFRWEVPSSADVSCKPVLSDYGE